MKKVSRRSFLFSAGAVTTAAFTLPLISMHENEKKYTGKKLNIALVGCGSSAFPDVITLICCGAA